MLKKIVLFIFACTLMFASESDFVKSNELGMFSDGYKEMAHKIYEIKKKHQQIKMLLLKINSVKRDNIVKEQMVSSLLQSINRMPIVENLQLNESSLGLQAEQNLNIFTLYSNQIGAEDIHNIIEK